MKKLTVPFLIVPLILLILGSCCITEFDKNAFLSIADPIMDNALEGLNEKNYDQFTRDFSENLKKKNPEYLFNENVEEFHQKYGRYISREIKEVSPSVGKIAVYCIANFEKAEEIGLKFTFEEIDGEYKIVKFYSEKIK